MKKFVIALAITATAAFAYAGPRAAGGHRMQKLAEKLGLSDAQKQQMRQIRQAAHAQNRQLFADFKAKRQEWTQLRDSGDPRADQLRSELKAMREQLGAARKAMHQQMLAVLTADQRDRIKKQR